MKVVVRSVGLVGSLCVIFLAQTAASAPMSYPLLAASQATVFVNNGAANLLDGGSFTTGLTGSVVMDVAAETVQSFSVSVTPNTMLSFCTPCTYAGQSSATIVSATLSSSDPFSGTAESLISGLFTFLGSTAEVAGLYSVGGGPSIPVTYGGSEISFQVNSLGVVVVTGQNLGSIDGSGFGEPEPLNIAANLTMVLGAPVTIPEPTTASLLLLGLLGLAGTRSRARR